MIMRQKYTTQMSVSDLIDIDYSLLQVISRMGLSLKYAGLPVSEACRNSGVDPDTFILICNVYSFPDHVPSESELEKGNIKGIIGYLHRSHLYYTGRALRTLEASFDRLVESFDERQKKVVLKFFNDYRDELDKHFAYEEEVVFPYVESLLRGTARDSEYSIEQFEEHHENVEEKLEDMKNIVMRYLPGDCSDELKIMVLLAIYHLHDDLRRHTYVENNILVPVVSRLEQDGE